MRIPEIDPNKPSPEEIQAHQREIAAHNMKIAKANLASELAGKLCSNSGLDWKETTPEQIASFSIGVAESIIDSYSLIPDAAGNKRGLVS
jgi:hypothetical protein